MRAIVCGGRGYADKKHLFRTLDEVHKSYYLNEIIEGGAAGADTLAREWAKARGIYCFTMKADWDQYGRRAGAMRNKRMLEQRPDAVIAFPGGTGTDHMVRIAVEANVKVLDYRRAA